MPIFEFKTEPGEIVREIEQAFSDEVEKVVRDVVKLAPAGFRRQMQASPPTGRKYGGHIAASRPNAPRNRTGALSDSFNGRMTGKTEGEISMLWYGAYLDDKGFQFIEQGFTEAIEASI